MTVTLNLKPELEAGLRAQAQASGVPVADYVQRILEERIGIARPERRLGPDEWSQEFEKWADSFPEAPPISDEALSRESLYPDRW